LIVASPTALEADATGRIWQVRKLPDTFTDRPAPDTRPQRLRNEIRRARAIA
jgi:hypothetical protein